MAYFMTLYSGSSGNSTLIRDGDTSLLVDMGRSCRATLASLYGAGLAASDIRAILVTHEHTDHVSGLMTFLKHYPVPVFGAARTLRYLRSHSLVPPHAQLLEIDGLTDFVVGDITIRSFTTSHDSEDCVGYRLTFASGATAAIATDLGYVSPDVYEAIAGCDLVALESNYDEAMLMQGPYPYYLKRRIRSLTGHLCNDACADVAAKLAKAGTRNMVLMHLSKENNAPELALTTCLSSLESSGIGLEEVSVYVAPRFEAGERIEV